MASHPWGEDVKDCVATSFKISEDTVWSLKTIKTFVTSFLADPYRKTNEIVMNDVISLTWKKRLPSLFLWNEEKKTILFHHFRYESFRLLLSNLISPSHHHHIPSWKSEYLNVYTMKQEFCFVGQQKKTQILRLFSFYEDKI